MGQTINKGSMEMEQDGYHLNQTGRPIHAAGILQALNKSQPSGKHHQETRMHKKQIEGQHQIKIKITNQK